jgi:hypothetical protein
MMPMVRVLFHGVLFARLVCADAWTSFDEGCGICWHRRYGEGDRACDV